MATGSLVSRLADSAVVAFHADWRGDGQRFELAVQFFPEPVGAVELSFSVGILDAQVLEPLSVTVDAGDRDGSRSNH